MSDSIRMVGQKEPNAFGVYDMHGNANEWCWDWYGRDSYASSPINDPRGPATGYSRVSRGGNFHGDAKASRSSARMGGGSPPEYINPYHTQGFRIVKKP
jgi:formylglycine-generating enzyme required for sulfatase activity